MERGSSKHSARHDDALAAELEGQLGPGGSNREEWTDPEPPADDDQPARVDPTPAVTPPDADAVDDPDVPAASQEEIEMQRLQHDMAIANDWNPADTPP